MEPNIITLTDQYGESVRFELLDIVEYEDQEFAVLYPADGGDDEPVHILRITSENLDLDEMAQHIKTEMMIYDQRKSLT